jgi:hypothetical protein
MPAVFHVTAFDGHRLIAAGTLDQVARRLRDLQGPSTLTFDDATGRVVDLDLRGSEAEVIATLSSPETTTSTTEAARGPGRPRLGVVAREVTLLPHHWDWLATQRGGASATLRRLVEDARREGSADDARRLAEERSYRFIAAIAGDLPGFEEASRALFAHDRAGFEARMSEWPSDVREYAMRLLG